MVSRDVGYVEGLRQHIGHAPIIMTCAGCAVIDDFGRVLLQRRGEAHGTWGLPGGAMELGETLEETAVRETREETALVVRPDELLGVYTGPLHTYANGDVDLGWFNLGDLPTPIFRPHEPMLQDLHDGYRGRWV